MEIDKTKVICAVYILSLSLTPFLIYRRPYIHFTARRSRACRHPLITVWIFFFFFSPS